MNITRNSFSPQTPNPIVQRSLDLRLRRDQAKNYLKWGIINSVLLGILIFDITQACSSSKYSIWYKGEYLFTIFLSLSTTACFGKYLWFVITGGQIFGSELQRCLLSANNDNSFKTIKSLNKPRICELDSEDDAVPIINWHSSFDDSSWSTQSVRRSPSPARTSQQQLNNTSFNSSMQANTSLNISNMSNQSSYMSPYVQMRRSDFLTDRSKLPALIKASERERSLAEASNTSSTNKGSANSFWNYYNNAAHILRATLYQIAPVPAPTEATQSIEEFGIFQYKDSNSEVIKRISTDRLSQYVANLRYWISTTILQRLVKEINCIDDVFRQRGLNDMKIGSVGFERLRKTAENQQFVQSCAPMLPMLLPFLDSFTNQEYLVQRIKELAQGSCIADYRWNSGNAHNGQQWGDHLPTDAAILFHLFCVYLDSQLLPLPQGGGRPFYSRYVLIRDEKCSTKDIINAVKNKAHCAILCTHNHLNPKFNFISEKELHSCVYDRNNLFYVIIQFLIYMRTQQESALEGVNLGKSGVNIMCVIDN